MCTSRKGGQLNKRSQNVKNTTLDMQSSLSLKSTLPFPHKFQPFLPMTRFLWKMWNDMPGVSKSFVQLFFSPIPATKTFHKHGFLLAVSHFLYHSRIATQLLTSQEPVTWPLDREQNSPLGVGKCNILKRKEHNKNFFGPKSFLQ